MSDEMKKPGGREYTVDEILAEYGSKGRRSPKPGQPSKVVDFPTEKLPPMPSAPPQDSGDEPTII